MPAQLWPDVPQSNGLGRTRVLAPKNVSGPRDVTAAPKPLNNPAPYIRENVNSLSFGQIADRTPTNTRSHTHT